ncbi:PDZ domain-containing protein [Candidatus Woesearchaeota archaeon]|nr:PDZ domain-containing protein [Candidatus Woesearchaeota archaeon]
MDFQSQAAIVFIILLALVLYANRKKLQIQRIIYPVMYIAMYRTKVGLNLMDRAAKKFPRFFKYAGFAGVFIGFIGMGMISYALVENIIKIMLDPSTPSGAALVLPFKVKGALYVPFFYWIICIFILVIIHEFSHGVISRLYNVRIKSSGLAFLGIILPVVPAAFVEPEEKQLAKKPKKEQLSVFAAGSFSNILLGFLCLAVFLLAFRPAIGAMVEDAGVRVVDLQKDDNITFPAENAGIMPNEIITSIDGNPIRNSADLSDYLGNRSPGDVLNITTNRTSYVLTLAPHPQNASQPILGIYLDDHGKVKESVEKRYGTFLPQAFLWFSGLILWLFLLNVGIGLFNLAPIPIADGGRMLFLALLHYFDEKKTIMIWKFVATFFIMLVLVNIGIGFIK